MVNGRVPQKLERMIGLYVWRNCLAFYSKKREHVIVVRQNIVPT